MESLPEEAPAYIAVDTKYWLYVNETLVVFDGRKTSEDNEFEKAELVKENSFGELYERPIPNIKLMDLNKGEYTFSSDNLYSLKLPYAMALSPKSGLCYPMEKWLHWSTPIIH